MSEKSEFIAYLTKMQKAGHVRASVDITWALRVLQAVDDKSAKQTKKKDSLSSDIDAGGFRE